MNSTDDLKQNWRDVSIKIRPRWPALTEMDVAAVDGSIDMLIEVLREKYGYTQFQAETEVNRFMDELGRVSMTGSNIAR
jgi:hypothetical protein